MKKNYCVYYRAITPGGGYPVYRIIPAEDEFIAAASVYNAEVVDPEIPIQVFSLENPKQFRVERTTKVVEIFE